MAHRRGRSLSEGLTLEQSEQGRVMVSSITGPVSAQQGIKEGDELVGATIKFDQLSKEQVMSLLQMIEQFDDQVHVLTKNKLSQSLDNLDSISKTPEKMLKDSYSKLYNTKIKKFMRGNSPGAAGGHVNGTGRPSGPDSSKLALRPATDLPRLGVDFGLRTGDRASVDGDGDEDRVVALSAAREFSAGSNMNLPLLSLGNKTSTSNEALHTPDVGLGVPDLDSRKRVEMPKFNMPDLNLSGPSLRGPDPHVSPGAAIGLNLEDLHNGNSPKARLSGRSPDVGLRALAPRSEGQVTLDGPGAPSLDLDAPSGTGAVPKVKLSAGAGSRSQAPDLRAAVGEPEVSLPHADLRGVGNYKAPKFKMPDFGLSAPVSQQVDLELAKLKALGKGPELDRTAPQVNVDAHAPSGKFKKPKFKLFGTLPRKKEAEPDVGLQALGANFRSPKITGVHGPDLPSANAHVGSPTGDLTVPDLRMPTIRGGLTGPQIKSASGDLSADLSRPSLGMDASPPKLDLQSPGIKGHTHGPDLDVPNVDIKPLKFDINAGIDSPKTKLKMPKFKMPSLSGPSPKGSGIHGTSGDVHGPKVSLQGPEVDFNSPHVELGSPKAKLKMPKFGLPSVRAPDVEGGLAGPDMKVKAPNVNLSGPSAKLSKPHFNLPDLGLSGPEFHAPHWSADGPTGSITSPQMKLSGTLPKGPSLDLDPRLSSPDVNLKGPKLKGGTDAPDWDLPNVDLKAPKLDLPDHKLGSSKAKLKMPKFRLPSLKGPDIDGAVDGPDVNLSAPHMDLRGPDVPNVGISGPTGTLKRPGLNLPGFSGPDFDLKSPNFGISSPNLRGGAHPPQVNMPEADLSAPHLNIGKLPQLNLPGTLPQGPSLDMGDLNPPDLSLRAPKLKGGLEGPDVDLPKTKLKTPKLDMNFPDATIGSPKAKFKLPKFKMPKLSLPGREGPDLDVDLKKPDLKGPTAAFDMPSLSGKLPKPTLPDLGLSGPDLDSPDFDLSSPDLDLSGAKFRGGLPDADLSIPKLDLSAPKLGAPDLDVNAPSAKVKMPKMNLSGSLPKGPSLDLGADLNSPDLSLKGPKLKGGIGGGDVDLPNMKLKSPKLDSPDINIGSPKPKLKLPKLRMPKFSLPGLKGPEIGGNIVGDVDMNAPDMDLKASQAGLDIPDVGFSGPSGKLKQPHMNLPDLSLSGPNFDLKSPDLKIPGADLKGGLNLPQLNMPDVDLKTPKADLSAPRLGAPDLDIDAPSANFKMPKMKLSGTLPKGPSLDLDPHLNSPDMGLKGPRLKGGIDAPDWDLPNMDLNAPKLNMPDLKFSSPKPKLKMPKFSLPSLKGPDIGGDVAGPDLNISTPHVDLRGAQDVDIPDADLSIPKLDLSAPKLGAPDLDVNAPSAKVKMPKMNLSGSLPKGPSLDLGADLNSPDLSLKGPKLKGGIGRGDVDLPNMKLKSPKLDSPDVNIGSPKPKLKLPKLRMPKFSLPGLKGPEIGGNVAGDVDINAPDMDLKASQAGLDIPDVGFSGPSGKLKQPHMNLPDLSLSGPNFDLKSPDLKIPGADLKAGINPPQLNMPDVDLKTPKVDLSAPRLGAPDLDIDAPSANFTMPKMKFPGTLPSLDLDADLNSPDLGLKAPRLKGNVDVDTSAPSLSFKGQKAEMPDLGFTGLGRADVKAPAGNISSPQADLDKTFKLPSIKMRGLGGTDLNRAGSDIDFGASLRAEGLDISPPNTKLSLKAPQMKGAVTAPNSELQDQHLHLKAPDLEWTDVDNPSLQLARPSQKTRKSDTAGSHAKAPLLDVDGAVRLADDRRKSSQKWRARSGNPLHSDANLDIDFSRSDLNIDDFTGKDHVLRARGSTLDLQAPNIPTLGGTVSASHQRSPKQRPAGGAKQTSASGDVKLDDATDGYYVTAFPPHTQSPKVNKKYATLGHPDFPLPNMDLEVPDNRDLKGSGFFFADLV